MEDEVIAVLESYSVDGRDMVLNSLRIIKVLIKKVLTWNR